jgi:alkylhydroperoxidase family enzyme
VTTHEPVTPALPGGEHTAVATPLGARMAPLTDAELSSTQREILSRGLERNNPRHSTLLRTIVRHHALYTAWQPLGNELLRKGLLPSRARELAILRTAWLCQCDFEWGQHVPIGLAEGLSPQDVAGVIEGREHPGWTAADSCVVGAADELLAASMIQDETWVELGQHFSDQQVIELIFVIGHYTMMAWVMRSLAIPLEDGAHGLDAHEFEYDEDSQRTVMRRWFGARNKTR